MVMIWISLTVSIDSTDLIFTILFIGMTGIGTIGAGIAGTILIIPCLGAGDIPPGMVACTVVCTEVFTAACTVPGIPHTVIGDGVVAMATHIIPVGAEDIITITGVEVITIVMITDTENVGISTPV